MNNLKCIFEPKSIAVIGASEIPGSVGHAIISNVLKSGFNGTVYPVNPKYKHVMSIKAYASINVIPDKVDLAVICVPTKIVISVVNQCAKKEIQGIVLITAGFKEVGEEGSKLENEIAEIAHKHNIRLIGPNCLGIINTSPEIKLNANFAMSMPKSGNVGLISQSGAIGVAAIDYAYEQDLGISKFASIGNKAVIDESDVLEYLIKDDATKIITMYIEDIGNPDRFFEMANRAAAIEKPIIVIKAGTSARGAKAIQSHTGALSSSDKAYDSLFAQCGVIRVTTLEELFELAKGFTCLVKPKGKRIAILTNGGGMGIIMTDASEKNKLEMATFDESTITALKKVLPSTANTNNPVDIIGDADAQRFKDALNLIMKDKNVDSVIVSVTPTMKTDMAAIASILCDFAKANPEIPILANLMSIKSEPPFIHILERENIPNFDFPEINIRVLAAMIKYYSWIKQPRVKPVRFKVKETTAGKILSGIKMDKRNHLSEFESYSLLNAYGMRSLDSRIAKNLNEAVSAAEEIGYPVVLKIISPDIMHKIDVGGVKINLQDENHFRKAFHSISESIKNKTPKAKIQGFLVQKYFQEKGIEIIVGVKAIKGFGHLIMFGSGGTFVELFKDVAFRLAPLTKRDAHSMIEETKGYEILKGYRGQTSYDIEAVVEYILRVSQLITDFPEIKELDMNPIKVLEDNKGIIVMDAKIVLEEPNAPVNKSKAKPKAATVSMSHY